MSDDMVVPEIKDREELAWQTQWDESRVLKCVLGNPNIPDTYNPTRRKCGASNVTPGTMFNTIFSHMKPNVINWTDSSGTASLSIPIPVFHHHPQKIADWWFTNANSNCGSPQNPCIPYEQFSFCLSTVVPVAGLITDADVEFCRGVAGKTPTAQQIIASLNNVVRQFGINKSDTGWIPSPVPNPHCLPEVTGGSMCNNKNCTRELVAHPAQYGCGGLRIRFECEDTQLRPETGNPFLTE